MSKYNARRCSLDGYTFDSASELGRYCELVLMLRAKLISNLRVHPKFPLVVNSDKIGHFTADFSYLNETGALVIEDCKTRATMTEASSLRIRIFEALYKLRVTIIGKDVPQVRKFKAPSVKAGRAA